jgi:hypothetical protein
VDFQTLLANLRRFATPGVLIAALVLALLFIGGIAFILFWSQPAAAREDPLTALTWIQGPTNTPAPTATLFPTSTPTAEFVPPVGNELGVGSYVQIVGTQGAGLNIRSSAGLSTTIQFLAYDAEVFVVRDGPQVVDNITWWYLVTPVDENRAGWAAADYLSVVANP